MGSCDLLSAGCRREVETSVRTSGGDPVFPERAGRDGLRLWTLAGDGQARREPVLDCTGSRRAISSWNTGADQGKRLSAGTVAPTVSVKLSRPSDGGDGGRSWPDTANAIDRDDRPARPRSTAEPILGQAARARVRGTGSGRSRRSTTTSPRGRAHRRHTGVGGERGVPVADVGRPRRPGCGSWPRHWRGS